MNLESHVAINGEGSIITFNIDNELRAYKLINDSWIQLGQNINVNPNGSNSLAISYDGYTIAVVQGYNNLKMYGYSNNKWSSKGDTSELYLSDNENAVDLNYSGNVVIIGEQSNDEGELDGGRARVFKFEDSTWSQVGQDIFGEIDQQVVKLGL